MSLMDEGRPWRGRGRPLTEGSARRARREDALQWTPEGVDGELHDESGQ